MPDPTPALTDAERSYGRVDPGLQLRGRWYSEASVARIKADAVAAALAPVERDLRCPHARAHDYEDGATCRLCGMPSWVEALFRAALAEDKGGERR